jgi:hypothetical protein
VAPTILVGIVGDGGFPNGSFLILVLGILRSVFDLIYVWMLFKVMTENGKRLGLGRFY